MKQPVAYIRKSRVTSEHTVSWEIQEAAIRKAAELHGHPDPLILSDWNRSGRGVARRPGYRRMLELIGADEVSAIYAYNLSRFSRSLKDFTALVDLCLAHEVPIRFAAESNLDVEPAATNGTGNLVRNIMAAVAQFNAEIAGEQAREAVAVRRARGDRIGHPFYGEQTGEDADAVVAAFREAGSVQGAARLLNARGIPTRSGQPWGSTTIRGLLARTGVRPTLVRPGAKAAAPFIFYGLLRCHCGHVLTGSRYRNGSDPGYTAYKCHFRHTVPGHGLGAVPEKRLLPWAKEEAARLAIPIDTIALQTQDEVRRAALAAKRDRWLEQYAEGIASKAERDAGLRAVTAELEALDNRVAVVRVPPTVDWSWDAKSLNAVLSTLWTEIRLDADLRPIEARWRVPEWQR